ncbi:hypothetical protein D3C72_1670620 [compost metagenome]
MISADAYASMDSTASAFAAVNAGTPSTPRAWNGSSSGSASAVASPHMRKNKEVVMVYAGPGLMDPGLCRICTGFALENALHASIFDAFCYQNDEKNFRRVRPFGRRASVRHEPLLPAPRRLRGMRQRIRQGRLIVMTTLQ